MIIAASYYTLCWTQSYCIYLHTHHVHYIIIQTQQSKLVGLFGLLCMLIVYILQYVCGRILYITNYNKSSLVKQYSVVVSSAGIILILVIWPQAIICTLFSLYILRNHFNKASNLKLTGRYAYFSCEMRLKLVLIIK